MLINKDKKIFLYEVDPLFFYDGSNDGFGDFRGFIKYIKYFDLLKVDGVIFPDIFNQEKTIVKPPDISIFDKYGKLSELHKIIDWFEENKIDFFMEIDLKHILDSNMNKNLQKKKIQDILIKNNSSDLDSQNWSTKQRIDLLNEIISFWTKNKIHNFIFTNFEDLYSKSYAFDNLLIEQLKKIYEIVKLINPNATINLKSRHYDSNIINNIFEKYIGICCDYFIDNSYAFLCTNKNYPNNVFQKFVPKKIFNKLKSLKIKKDFYKNYVISFSSNEIGRVSSRWMNEKVLHQESIKSLLLLINSLPYSTITYYGDEIGTLRTHINSINDYYDFDYNEKKRYLESKGLNENKFHHSQKYLSPIHAQSLMMWNASSNGGFSSSNKLIRHKPINYLENNVLFQQNKKDSILNFYRSLIEFTSNTTWNSFFNNTSKIKITKLSFKNIFIYHLTNNKNEKIKILINPTNKSISKKIKNKNQMIISTYFRKNEPINNDILFIKPYESFIYVKVNKMVK